MSFRTELLVVPDVSIPIKKKPPSSTSSDEHLTEAEDSDSENDEAFLPVAASVVVGQIERNKINVSPTASLRYDHGYWNRLRYSYNSSDFSFCTLPMSSVQGTKDRAWVLELSDVFASL